VASVGLFVRGTSARASGLEALERDESRVGALLDAADGGVTCGAVMIWLRASSLSLNSPFSSSFPRRSRLQMA
jgi:hypothetical protein